MHVPFSRMPLDSGTLINWRLDEASGTISNQTGGGACALSNVRGSQIYRTRPSPVMPSMSFVPGGAMYTPNTSVGEVTNKLTVSFWFWQWTTAASTAGVGKKYQVSGTWASPFTSISCDFNASHQAGFDFGVCVAGTRYFINNYSTNETSYTAQLNAWHLAAFTYDGATHTQCIYVDGLLVASGTPGPGGNIDFGTHGPWYVGGMAATDAGTNFIGNLCDVRIENVVRSAGYIEAMYRMGVGGYRL